MRLNLEELQSRLALLFQENFDKFGELGAAVSVWYRGRPVVDLYGGFRDARREQPWTAKTIVLIWSATKGLGSACLLHVLQENGISLEQPVAQFWPEFGQAGKDTVTLAQLLSHQAGLAALDEPVDVLDYPAVIAALEKQRPLWPPGTAHGYHARTFGFLLDELVRRISGKRLYKYWREMFGDPLALDLWIGLPNRENSRAATMYAPKHGKAPAPASFYRDLVRPGTLAHKAFTSLSGLQAVSAMNLEANRARPIVSFGGIGSAVSLAKFYAMLADGGAWDGKRYFTAATLKEMEQTLAAGPDRILQIPTAFSAGFMKDLPGGKPRIFGPSARAFGHPGAGGSHAFADPENQLSFAYVMNRMEQSVLPNEKSLRLVRAIYQ
jgi:CubicO group peptidase (beta-lactamase class C family)